MVLFCSSKAVLDRSYSQLRSPKSRDWQRPPRLQGWGWRGAGSGWRQWAGGLNHLCLSFPITTALLEALGVSG